MKREKLSEEEHMFKIFNELKKSGYDKGDDIPYFVFSECCEQFGGVDDIDINKFEKKYSVEIG